MDPDTKLYDTARYTESDSFTVPKADIPAELRRFEVVLQCDIEELPATSEVKLNFRRVIICKIELDKTVQDVTEDDADFHGLPNVSKCDPCS